MLLRRSNKHVMVLGGSQFIGFHVVSALLQEGYQVTVVNRGRSNRILPKQVQKIIADRDKPEQLEKVIKSFEGEAIIDFSCFTPNHLIPILNNLQVRGIKYVFISTVYVYGHYSTLLEDEFERMTYLDSINVNSERKATKWYGLNKIKCEDLLLDKTNHNMNVTILRLVTVIGYPNNEFERENFYITKIRNMDTLELPWGGKHLFHFIYVKDICKVCCSILEGKTKKNIYIVGSRKPIKAREYIILLAKALNKSIIIKELDDLISKKVVSTERYPFIYPCDIVYDSQELWNEIGEDDTPIGQSIITDLRKDAKRFYQI